MPSEIVNGIDPCSRRITARVVGLLLLGVAFARGQSSDVHRDEEIVFFPALVHRVSGADGWECEIRGCIYEPEKRGLTLALLREALAFKHVEMTAAEAAVFRERARLFMADNQGGREIAVRVGERDFALGKSGPDGQFAGAVRLSDAEAGAADGNSVPFQAILPADDPRRIPGRISLVVERGVSVISDIDDTIKDTQVGDRKVLLRRTFLEAFKPVPGMAGVYRAWADASGAQFCYVSASPWQLFLPLTEFVSSNGFPAGAFRLRRFRWKDESLFKFFEGPALYKPSVIEPLLQEFPRRQFVLVGDSGERDPESYADLARRHPQQIAKILIRNVTAEPPDSERFQKAFRDLPPGLWQIFRDPAEITKSCPPRPGG